MCILTVIKGWKRLMTWRRLPLMVPFDGSPEQSSHRLSSEKFDWSGQCQGRLTQRKPQKLSSPMYSAWEPVTRPPPSICTCAYQKWSKELITWRLLLWVHWQIEELVWSGQCQGRLTPLMWTELFSLREWLFRNYLVCLLITTRTNQSGEYNM